MKLIGFIFVVVSVMDIIIGCVFCLYYNIEVRCSCCYINMLLLFNCKCENGILKKKIGNDRWKLNFYLNGLLEIIVMYICLCSF